MGEQTTIEWTHHTFSPWWGCSKVSPGCTHCYADTFSKRVGHGKRLPTIWGPTAERRYFGDAHWAEPLKWNAKAEREGVRRRVFCASMADVFEAYGGRDVAETVERAGRMQVERDRLFALIGKTPHLDWLLLTKRPENVARMVPGSWMVDGFPRNVWMGTTAEDQRRANERVPAVLALPARVHFLSCEPMLGPVNLLRVNASGRDVQHDHIRYTDALRGFTYDGSYNVGDESARTPHARISWVIGGGESGPHARPMHPEWIRSLRDQCVRAGTPFLFKQWGEWAPWWDESKFTYGGAETARKAMTSVNPDGSTATVWIYDDDGSVQNNCGDVHMGSHVMTRAGKKAAGRELDGREWNEFPEVR